MRRSCRPGQQYTLSPSSREYTMADVPTRSDAARSGFIIETPERAVTVIPTVSDLSGHSERKTAAQRAGFSLPLIVVLCASLLTGLRLYDVGFNVGDEGSAILIAEEMLDGRVLYRDLISGYNPLWHLSLEAAFAIFGESFLVFRVFHLILAALAALFGYLAVARIGHDRRLAVLAGVLIALFPGPLHKVFIPLLTTVSLYAISRLDFERTDLPLGAMIVPSVVVALA